MKKNILLVLFAIFSFAIIIGLLCVLPVNKKKDRETIRVAEVTHSVFYTPFYVALENGYFEEEGLDIELLLVSGSDNVAASVLSKDTDIGLAGPESALFTYTGGEKDYLKVFCGLTKRDGQFVFSKSKDFSWEDLINKEILVGRSTGMPALSFFQALKNQNINMNDVSINTSVEFAELSGAFIGGNGDYVNLFEPLATKLEQNGYGYVNASVGLYSDEFPYTAFYAKDSYIKKNKDLLKRFNKAIEKGMKYTLNNDAKDIAKSIKKQFSDTDIDTLTTVIERYKEADVWLSNTYINKQFYNTLIKLLEDNNLIDKQVYYKDLVSNINE